MLTNNLRDYMKLYFIWLGIGLILFHGYFLYIGSFIWLYSDSLFLIVYLLRYFWRKEKLPKFFYESLGWKRYLIAAYGMVLLEEMLAALVNNLDEGFSFTLYNLRVLQFWAFNLLAFSGLIFGVLFLFRKRLLSKKELIILTSLFGLWSEHQFALIFVNPIAVLVYAPIVVAIYYVIFTPAITLLGEQGSLNNLHKFARYSIGVIVIFICSVPFMIILAYLRTHFPDIFPPCSMIACDT